MRKLFIGTLLLALLALSLPLTTAHPAAETGTSPLAAELDAGVLVKWMQMLYDRTEAEAVNAPAASRLYAYAGITAFQAILPGIPEGISMSGQLSAMPDTPFPEEEGVYDWPASANAAMGAVIKELFKNGTPQTLRDISNLQDSLTASRERATSADIVARSARYGEAVAAPIIEWINSDNYAETRDMQWEMPTGDPSLWVPTAPGQQAVEPFWGQIRPFALYDPSTCNVPMNVDFSTEPDSTFYLQALEVKTVGDNLTNEQKDIARYWVDTPGDSGAPAGHWVLIENQMVDRLDLKLDRAAMMYALVGTALGDAFISAWCTKYEINLIRPVTYIQEYVDPNWQSLIATPGFPEYPSGHSVVSGAAGTVLTRMFGQVAFTDRSGRKHGFKDRSFTSFWAAASEAAISRMYGGIHYRAAIENGLDQGRCIGNQVVDYVLLRSVPQGE
jgi:hypothetical protein